MSVSTVKAKRKNVIKAQSGHHKKESREPNLDTILTEIENDPNATLIAKELAVLRRKRDQSGEPYLTIEQIQAELGRS